MRVCKGRSPKTNPQRHLTPSLPPVVEQTRSPTLSHRNGRHNIRNSIEKLDFPSSHDLNYRKPEFFRDFSAENATIFHCKVENPAFLTSPPSPPKKPNVQPPTPPGRPPTVCARLPHTPAMATRKVRYKKLNTKTLLPVLREDQIDPNEYESLTTEQQIATGVEQAEENVSLHLFISLHLPFLSWYSLS